MCKTALEVREILSGHGINVTVVDPVFVKPLDEDLMRDILGRHRVVFTVEEHALIGGLGSIINNFVVKNGFSDTKVVNCGIDDVFVEQGGYGDLLNEVGLTAEKLVATVLKTFYPENHS